MVSLSRSLSVCLSLSVSLSLSLSRSLSPLLYSHSKRFLVLIVYPDMFLYACFCLQKNQRLNCENIQWADGLHVTHNQALSDAV